MSDSAAPYNGTAASFLAVSETKEKDAEAASLVVQTKAPLSKDFWDRLPIASGKEAAKTRAKFFRTCDMNGNGYLSSAEIDGCLQKEFGLDKHEISMAVQRAFWSALSVQLKVSVG